MKFNYSEFYFNNDRSSYLDKVEMKVYRIQNNSIAYIVLKHKTLTSTKYYVYMYSKNVVIKE
ncbi:MAG: hypothetical protein N2560_03440 [Ignavibacteria bacterium]|nr:hypothetical protein [Ignavibacteria bacterium]